MAWSVYEVPPVDANWRFLKTVAATAREIGGDSAHARAMGAPSSLEGPDIEEFLSTWQAAREAARQAGWDGDFRHEPVVFWVPGDTEFRWGFVIKQDNNGTTYVVSPVPMPHLDELA